jgi:transcriptional regulator with PAS, ATPase and Fis domain
MRIHMLGGLFHMEGPAPDPLSVDGAVLVSSYEAEQHLLHFGVSDVPVCWTICGLISGYLSCAAGAEIFVMEDRCTGAGGGTCHLRARSRADWGSERMEDLEFFESKALAQCLDVSLKRVTETLKAAERKLRKHKNALREAVPEIKQPLGIVADSVPMRTVVDLARRVAKVDSTVLITGESGSGKERIARLVHEESVRVAGPFIAVNCAAITETLLESELFGHKRGAFTGATHDRAGLFEAANGGTLLLDEIGEVSAGMQVKLLRVLQEREVRRVGENRSRPVDVRVLAATNRDLSDGVTAGALRRDLYYRLNVVELHVPALRNRRVDILPLARLLLAETALRVKRPITSISPAAAQQLLRHPWPGNVRELENAMERSVALARGDRVELEDLPEEVRTSPPIPIGNAGPVRSLADVEKDYILAALELNGGNQTRTAAQLHIGSATLYRKLKAYGMIGARYSGESVAPGKA